MPEIMEADKGELPRPAKPPPIPAEIVGRQKGAVGIAKDQRLRLHIAHTEGKAKLHQFDLVRAEHRYGLRRQSDIPPATLCLWGFYPQSGLGFLDAPLDPQGCTVEVDVTPLEGKQLPSSHSSFNRQSHDRIKKVIA